MAFRAWRPNIWARFRSFWRIDSAGEFLQVTPVLHPVANISPKNSIFPVWDHVDCVNSTNPGAGTKLVQFTATEDGEYGFRIDWSQANTGNPADSVNFRHYFDDLTTVKATILIWNNSDPDKYPWAYGGVAMKAGEQLALVNVNAMLAETLGASLNVLRL